MQPRRRTGQALVETALGLVIFLGVVALFLDASWLYYHQVSLTRAVQRTARLASTNQVTREDLRKNFFDEMHNTQAAAGDEERTRLTIETTARDLVYKSAVRRRGAPSVLVRVAHDHHPLVSMGRSVGLTLTAESRAPIEVWPARPAIMF